jgi:hypothetical protein
MRGENMFFLTKNEIESVENALRNLGVYPPWDVPVEKYFLYLLTGLSEKVAIFDKRLIELEKRVTNIKDHLGAIDK